MPKVVGIRFRGTGKIYHFDPQDLIMQRGDAVIVKTSLGVALGIVAEDTAQVPVEDLKMTLQPVLRLANDDDLIQYDENCRKEKEAYHICRDKIAAHKLDMHLIDVECAFNREKIVFYFSADGRIDFRALVKDLASVFHMRIELRQIGVRDEARMKGGLGVCGREFCCTSHLTDFVPVSIKMAKLQNLSMNPAKISGACGRLMCCLKYEHAAYEDAINKLPKKGSVVKLAEGEGIVQSVNLLKETVAVRLNKGGDSEVMVVPYSQLSGEEPDLIDSPAPSEKSIPARAEALKPKTETAEKQAQPAKSKRRRSSRKRSSRSRNRNRNPRQTGTKSGPDER